MKKAWQYTWGFVFVAVLGLLLTMPCPTACATNGSNGTQTNGTALSTTTTDDNSPVAKPAATTRAKAKPVVKTRDRSVLDAEALDSPLSYFKEAFTPEEDSNSSPALVNTVKALVATLLSTVM